MNVHNRAAIVAGGASGLGAATARALAARGARVAVLDRNPEGARTVAAEIGGIAATCDVTDEAAVLAAIALSREAHGPLRVVVHCAGILPMRTIVEDQDLSLFDQVITINLRGSYAVMAESARQMTRGGRSIAFSSSEVAKSFPRYGAYSASKAAVESLVHTLANELRGREITVNAVAPGPVATDLFLNGKSQAQIDELTKLAPLERLARREDIVGTVSFLAGPDGAWVNSQVLRPNGGFVY